MKKLLCVLMSVLMALSLAACGQSNGISQEDYDKLRKEYEELKEKYEQIVSTNTLPEPPQTENPEQTEPSGKFDTETVISQLEVQEYTYRTKFSEYLFLAVRNNSEYNIEMSVSAKFYNEESLVGAKTTSQEAFEHGTEIVIYFMPDEAYTSVEYDISVSEETWYKCITSELSYETTAAKNKEIVSVTNNGEYAAEFVECHALFFKDGKVVGHSGTYFTDNDFELKPGKTITEELDCYEEYDDVKFFFTGRR